MYIHIQTHPTLNPTDMHQVLIKESIATTTTSIFHHDILLLLLVLLYFFVPLCCCYCPITIFLSVYYYHYFDHDSWYFSIAPTPIPLNLFSLDDLAIVFLLLTYNQE